MGAEVSMMDRALSSARLPYLFKYASDMRIVIDGWFSAIPLLFGLGPVRVRFKSGKVLSFNSFADFASY
jgi:hypothetical protein